MTKRTKIYLLPGIIFILLIAIHPAALADRIYTYSDFNVIQSGEERDGGSSNSFTLLEEASLLEKKGDFKSALPL